MINFSQPENVIEVLTYIKSAPKVFVDLFIFTFLFLCFSFSVDDYTSGYMPSLAMVYNNGRVFWGPVVRFRSSCKIDITYFPFDDQVRKYCAILSTTPQGQK